MRKTVTLERFCFILALGTVLDRCGPPTRGSTVLRGTDRFRTVRCVFTLVIRTVLEPF